MSESRKLLETFDNQFPARDYEIKIIAGIHLDLPGDRPAGFRRAGDRLRAAGLDRGEQELEAFPAELPQPGNILRKRHEHNDR